MYTTTHFLKIWVNMVKAKNKMENDGTNQQSTSGPCCARRGRRL